MRTWASVWMRQQQDFQLRTHGIFPPVLTSNCPFSKRIVFLFGGKLYITQNLPFHYFKGIVEWHYVHSHHCANITNHPSLKLLSSSPSLSPSASELFSQYAYSSFLKWNHTVFILWWLAYFTLSINVLKVHCYCTTCQNGLPFQGWITFDGIYMLQFAYPSMDTGCFHRLAIVNNTSMILTVQITVGVSVFNSFEHKLRSGIAGSYLFWGTVIKQSYFFHHRKHFHQQSIKILFPPHPHRHVIFNF